MPQRLVRFLLVAGHHAAGYRYGSPAAGDELVDCSSYTWRVLQAWLPEARWDDRARGDIVLWEGRGPWAPVEAVVRVGVGRRVDVPAPGRIHLVQGWRWLSDLGTVPPPTRHVNGHQFFFLAPHDPRNPGWLIQATNGIGWWRESTWADVTAPYEAGVHLAALELT